MRASTYQHTLSPLPLPPPQNQPDQEACQRACAGPLGARRSLWLFCIGRVSAFGGADSIGAADLSLLKLRGLLELLVARDALLGARLLSHRYGVLGRLDLRAIGLRVY